MLRQNNALRRGDLSFTFPRVILAGILACALSACQAHSVQAMPVPPAKKPAPPRPHGKLLPACMPTGYAVLGWELLLAPMSNRPHQRLYVFYNTDKKRAVSLGLAPAGTAASAGWDTQLQPNHWTALALARTDFRIRCTVDIKGKYESASCLDVIRACQIAEPDFMKGTEGSYWLAEDQVSAEALQQATGDRGVSW